MTDRIPDKLQCPDCSQPLNSTPSDGRLVCSGCHREVPVVEGIPRFVEQQHLASFGLQWNRYEVAHEDEDLATFQAKTGFSLSDLKGASVLDAGCGGGRYCRIAAESGARVYGADHSSAVEKASKLCADFDQVRLVQADLKHLPFAEESFDFAFSIGVMHHDVETRPVFDAVARMVRPGGQLAVWLYRRNQWWQEWLNDRLRSRTVKMAPEKLEKWCVRGARLGGIPGIKQTCNKVINFSNHPSFENRVCDTFDWYAPDYQHHHTEAELTSWFEAAGYKDLRLLPPEKTGRFYRWTYRQNLLIGSGVNMVGTKR